MIWRVLIINLVIATSVWAGASTDFNGTTSEVQVTDHASIQDAEPFSVAAWINSDSRGESNAGCIVCKRGNSDSGRWLFIHSNAETDFTIRFTKACSDTDLNVVSNEAMSFSTWYHVAAPWDRDWETARS